jgi:hypothetical protein
MVSAEGAHLSFQTVFIRLNTQDLGVLGSPRANIGLKGAFSGPIHLHGKGIRRLGSVVRKPGSRDAL